MADGESKPGGPGGWPDGEPDGERHGAPAWRYPGYAWPVAEAARETLSAGQERVLCGALAALGLAVLQAPGATLLMLFQAAAALCMALAVWRGVLSARGLFGARVTGALLRDKALPTLSVLVALRHEEAMAPRLSAALRAMDYPADRLEVILLVEADDPGTAKALRAQSWPGRTRLLTVPEGRPLTKPRALNYGLERAGGEIVTVFDAEDRPHPLQARAAATRLAEGADALTCVQAPLQGRNGGAAWISAHWCAEYAVHFGGFLPALSRLRAPILLGGTSNYFRTAVLRQLGAWDAWNVTEDADLGLRMHRAGSRVGAIQLPTAELAPTALAVWVRQRSRWIKGFLQTLLVHARRPRRFMRECGGPASAAALLTMLAGTASSALHLPLLAASLALLAGGNPAGEWALALSGIAWAASAALVLCAPGPRQGRLLAASTLPLYWLLHSVAAAKAVGGLLRDPHFWAKTPHPCPPG